MTKVGAAMLALVTLGCARTPPTPAPDAAAREPGPAARWLDSVDAHPNARPLCDEHVMAAPGAPPPGDADPIREIHWLSFATPASPEEVAQFYATRGMPLDAEHSHKAGRVVLSVYPVTDTLHPSCSEQPKPGERSVIIVSRALP